MAIVAASMSPDVRNDECSSSELTTRIRDQRVNGYRRSSFGGADD